MLFIFWIIHCYLDQSKYVSAAYPALLCRGGWGCVGCRGRPSCTSTSPGGRHRHHDHSFTRLLLTPETLPCYCPLSTVTVWYREGGSLQLPRSDCILAMDLTQCSMFTFTTGSTKFHSIASLVDIDSWCVREANTEFSPVHINMIQVPYLPKVGTMGTK